MASTSVASPRAAGEPKLIIPGLAGFYEWAEPYTYPLMRFCVGAMLFPIGWTKLQNGMAPVVATMTKYGLEPVGLMAFIVIALELVGALCIAVGFLTRFWAAALAIEMAVISYDRFPTAIRASSNSCSGACSLSSSRCAAAGASRSTGRSAGSFNFQVARGGATPTPGRA